MTLFLCSMSVIKGSFSAWIPEAVGTGKSIQTGRVSDKTGWESRYQQFHDSPSGRRNPLPRPCSAKKKYDAAAGNSR